MKRIHATFPNFHEVINVMFSASGVFSQLLSSAGQNAQVRCGNGHFLFAKLSLKKADENAVLILMLCVFEHTIIKISGKKP